MNGITYMNNVVWLSLNEHPGRGYWDQQLLEDLFVNKTHHTEIGKLKEAIVVVPGAYQKEKGINKELEKLDKCVVIITSDEENKFDTTKLTNKVDMVYRTYPDGSDSKVIGLPIGYTPHSKTTGYLDKDIDLLFAGQVNHDSRQKMIREVSNIPTAELDISKGFAQGLKPENYVNKTRRAKVIPSPRGNISPDSFRMYEALEHGALPIAEDKEFFDLLFKLYPFPVIDETYQWFGYSRDAIDQFPKPQNQASAWWLKYKESLWNEFNEPDEITVVIPVSPIKSHPDTRILDETIKSIRAHLDCRIVITFDGVREEQEDKRKDYELFINNILSSGYDRIYPVIYKDHLHQSGMMRDVLQYIKTPYILYVEQDTPLTPDMSIEWDKCINLLETGESNCVRFHFESEIPKEHKHMMLGEPRKGFLKTAQWSQRPHLATTAFYKRIMNEYFSEKNNCFIEDNMHGRVWNSYREDGGLGWNQFRIHIYHPAGNIKRSYHTDGRENETKYDDRQIF